MSTQMLDERAAKPTYASVLDETLAYESSHNVGEYTINGLNVWPYLRVNTAWRKLNESSKPTHKHSGVRHAANRALRYARLMMADKRMELSPARDNGDIVFVTLANRRERIGGKYWQTMVDSLASEFEKRGVTTFSCEAGQALWPRARKSFWISRHFKLARVTGRIGDHLTKPAWFDEYATWATSVLGRPVGWDFWESPLREMFSRAAYFEDLFGRVKAKAVFVDCWYSPESLAATLAARRAGLLTVELQHGLQGAHMNGYSGWSQDYQLIPKLFWVWGETAVTALRERNTAHLDAVAGGNWWLNAWRSGNRPAAFEQEIQSARKLRAGKSCAILVTLQPQLNLDGLCDAMRDSPRDWAWLIRVHRKMRTAQTFAATRALLEGLHPNVSIDEPSELPLYALMSAIDVHATGFSTCAIEALAFGKPTVAFDANAREAFGSLLQSGAMTHAETGPEILNAVREFTRFDASLALALAESHYTSSARAEPAFAAVQKGMR